MGHWLGALECLKLTLQASAGEAYAGHGGQPQPDKDYQSYMTYCHACWYACHTILYIAFCELFAASSQVQPVGEVQPLMHVKAPGGSASLPMCRFEGLDLPSLAENYNLDNGAIKGHLQAGEHRDIMQLMPFAALFAAHDTLDQAGLPLVEIIIWYDILLRSAELPELSAVLQN